jgi:uncharacterized caspase-like protein
MKRLGIFCGLTRLDPAAYDGWEGECPGCDVDVAEMATLAHRRGFDGVIALTNALVTRETMHGVYRDVCERLEAGDLLLLYYSGHGGQVADDSGDEPDDLDETLCWWDGELSDDEIAENLSLIPAGVRVLYVTDSCHAGSNFRGRMKDERSRMKDDPSSLILHPLSLQRAAAGMRASLLHFGGCADDRYSYGEATGGVFTQALIASLGKRRQTYYQWFAKAAKRMPKDQTPVLAEWGQGTFGGDLAMT